MNKRLAYIGIGAASFVAFELVLEGIQYTNPPDWFYPIWMIFYIIFQIIAIPAHLAHDYVITFMGMPLLVKPTFADMGMLRVSLLLLLDLIEGTLLGWLFFVAKSRTKK